MASHVYVCSAATRGSDRCHATSFQNGACVRPVVQGVMCERVEGAHRLLVVSCRVVSYLCGGQVWGGDDLGEGSAAHEVRVEEGADLLRVRATQGEGEREEREREVSI